MTLAPNPRPLLSGNKLLLLLVVLLIAGMQSCKLLFPEDPEPEPEPDDPVVEEPEEPEEEIDTFDVMYPEIDPDTIRVAYMLPFFFESEISNNPTKQQLQQIARKFYQGSRIALDTLEKCGYQLEVEILDSKNDTNQLEALKSEISDFDPHLIIGPFFQDHVRYMSSFIEENKYNTVAPVANIERCLIDNPYVFFSNPSVKRFGEVAAKLANQQFAPITPVVIRRERTDEARLADFFVENLDFLVMDSLREFSFRRGEWEDEAIKEEDLGEANFVFIPSGHEPFVSTMLTTLQLTGKDFIVVGLDRWQKFSRIDGILWKRYNVHLLGSYFIDFDRQETIRFAQIYREDFETEPDEFAFRGFDETRLFINEIVRSGVYFQRDYYANPVMDELKGIHKSYIFKDEDYCGSWVNQYINLLRFEDDYRLRKRDLD